MDDLISRQAAIDEMAELQGRAYTKAKLKGISKAWKRIKRLPSVHPETCEGCVHLGKWENEVEYGYSSPCTRCKRRVEDHYER